MTIYRAIALAICLQIAAFAPEGRTENGIWCVYYLRAVQETEGPSVIQRLWEKLALSYGNFRAEVKEKGRRRYIIAPRATPEKFDWFAALTDPIFGLPVEAASKIKMLTVKRPIQNRLSAFTSLPATFVVFAGLGIGTALLDAHNNTDYMTPAIQQDLPGASYIFQMAAAQTVDLTAAVEVHKQFHRDFSRIFSGQAPIPRLQQFVNLRLITVDQARELNNLAVQAAQEVTDAGMPDKEFDTKLRQSLRDKVTQSATLKNLPTETLAALDFIFWPQLEVGGHPDLEIFLTLLRSQPGMNRISLSPQARLSMNGVWELAEKHIADLGLGAFMALTEQSIDNQGLLADKVREARSRHFPEDHIAVAARPDLPAFAREFDFYQPDQGKVQTLDEELDRWDLILGDWRFLSIKESWLAGEMSSMEALTATEQLMRSLDQLYRVENPHLNKMNADQLPAPTVTTMCELTGHGTAEKANPIFTTIEANIEKFSLTGSDADFYRYYTGLVYWYLFAQDAANKGTDAQRDARLKAFQTKEEQVLQAALTGTIDETLPLPKGATSLACP